MASNNTTGNSGSPSRTVPHISIGTPARVLFVLTLVAALLAVVLNAVYAQTDPTTPSPGADSTPVATPSADMPRLQLDLEEVNESDLGGTVTLYDNGDSTIVEFAATGAGGDHPAVIVPGVCGETTDDEVTDLVLVDNTGRSTTSIDTSLDDLLAEDHSIEIRMSEAEADTVIACALIEGQPSLEGEATPAASPEVTPGASPEVTPAASPEAEDPGDGVGGNTADDGTGGSTGADAAVLTIDLVDWSEAGVTGTAVLTDQGDTTQVVVNISGPSVVGGHELHIHNGTCGNPGSATYTLNPIDANGSSTSTVNLSLSTLTSGSYFINIHPDEANWDAWMACGNIEGTTGTVAVPAPTSTPVTSASDGSTGGNTTLVTTNAQAGEFPTTVGVGDALRWPSDTRTSVVWAVAGISIMLMAAGLIVRHGERTGKQARFTRLGL